MGRSKGVTEHRDQSMDTFSDRSRSLHPAPKAVGERICVCSPPNFPIDLLNTIQSIYKWTRVIQIHAVLGSTMVAFERKNVPRLVWDILTVSELFAV